MKPCLGAVLALVASWVVLLSPHAAFADQDKEAELLKRLERLEKRVEELEKAIIALRPSAKDPATETVKKLVGNWTITDADKKNSPWTELNLKADGTCDHVSQDGKVNLITRYRVTKIGSVTQIDFSWSNNVGVLIVGVRLASVTETKLVLEFPGNGDTWQKVRYTRKKADPGKTGSISGKVLYKGRPLAGGTVAFHPLEGKAAAGIIQADGTYEVRGVPAGEVKVTVETESVKVKSPPKDTGGLPKEGKAAPRYVPIPRLYADALTTPLRGTVTAGKQTFDITLR
jgi:hypothetical protein